MLCRVYTCWMPARRSSQIWSRPICFSPWGFWVRFDDIAARPRLSLAEHAPSLSCSGGRSTHRPVPPPTRRRSSRVVGSLRSWLARLSEGAVHLAAGSWSSGAGGAGGCEARCSRPTLQAWWRGGCLPLLKPVAAPPHQMTCEQKKEESLLPRNKKRRRQHQRTVNGVKPLHITRFWSHGPTPGSEPRDVSPLLHRGDDP